MSEAGAIKGRYEKRQVLGEGGMGVVYRAYDADLKREVALKTLRDGGDELALEMFRKECGVLASLNHPNIVDIYDVGQFEEGGVEKPYFVMPLLPGTTLDRIIKNEPQRLTVERTVEIIAQTCRGLHAAHERGLIHRDLKPSNIFVLADDSVKIIDFGIAHLTGTHTSVGLKGTLYYMAPEQMELKPASPQSDIYSLGVVCYEILAQRRPFLGANRDEVMRAIMRGSAAPVFELNPLVSQGLSQVIHAALAKRPQSRYQTSREFADCLQKALRNQPIERFSPDKVEPRLQRVEKALAGEEFEFANEVLTGLEEEGQIHPAIHTLRNRLDHTLRERTITQLMESARRRFSENEYQLALQKVQEVLQLDPRHAAALGLRADIESRRSAEQIEGWVRLARQHLDVQKFSLAREALGNALAINPQDTQANSLRGEIERLERTVGESRAKKRELYQQAQEAWQRGDVTAALTKIEKVVEADRQAPEPGAVELTNTYLNFYNRVRVEHDSLAAGYEEAKQHVANGNFQAAGEICDRFLAKYPSHALFQALRFDVGERLHQTVSADMARVDREMEAEPDLDRRVKILEAAVARHPGEAHFREALKGVASKRDLVNSVAQKARSFEESGQFQEAISQWDILRNIYPQFPGLDVEVERLKKRREQRSREDARSRWAERIEAAINAGDYPRAIELASSSLAEFPGDADLAGLEKQARQSAERSREADGLLAKGRELKAAGKLVEAAAALKKASELDPRNPATRAALVDVMVAHAAGQVEKDWNNADGWLDQALALDANHAQARTLKALVGDKRREAAINESLTRVRELQAAGNLRGAYQEVLSGLAAFPLDNRLTQLKTQLSRAIEDAEKSAAPPPPAAPAPPPPGKQTGRKEKAAAPPPPPPPPATPKPPAAASVPPPKAPLPPPPPPVAAAPTPGKKPSIWAAALAVPVLAIAGWFFLKPGAPPPSPPVESKLVALQLTVDPPTARVRAGGKDFGANRNIELPEGDHELEVYGDGIKPLRVPVKVTKGMSAPPAIQAELETPSLVLALSGARATLDGKLLTAGGSQPIAPGDHTLEIYQGAVGRGTVVFTIAPGDMPAVKSAVARGLFLTAAAVLGPRGRVFGGVKGALGPTGDLADIPATGLEINSLATQPQPFRVTDGTETRAYDLTATPAPTLAVFVADPGRVDLTISSNEDGATVQINGRPSGPIAKGQHLAQLMPGVYKVKVSKPGFADVERTVTLAKGRAAREQFDLKAVLASVKVVGATGRAQIFIDGKPAGDMGPGDALVVNAEPGRHRLSVKAEHHQTTDRDYELRSGSETVVAFRELAVPVGYVQLSAPPGYSVSYAMGNDRPQAAVPGRLSLPVGDYVFRATASGGGAAPEPQSVSVRLGQAATVTFAPPKSNTPTTTTTEPRTTSSTAAAAPTLFGSEWKDDDGWQKLDGGRQAAVPGSPAGLSFQVRRKGAFLGLGGKPGWHYMVGADFVRFELSGDKLAWWVTNSKERDKKRGEVPVPKDAEDVRIEITPAALKVLVGGQGRDVTAADAGMASFAGGQFRFRGPISIKGLSVKAR